MMIYSDQLLYHACQESNRIEGEPLEGRSFDNHFRVALLAQTAAKEKQLLHPRVVHQLLFEKLPLPDRLQQLLRPGDYRPPGVNVFVRDAGVKHVFPDAIRVPALMGEWWSEWCNSWYDGEPNFYSALVRFGFHSWFEDIHPFHDGNGRVGRVLWWNMTMIADEEIEIISYEERESYFTRLRNDRAAHCNKPDMNPFR